jgi:hypothetical protein
MNQTRTLVEMGDYYEKNVIEEKKSVFPPKGTFKKAEDKKPVEATADKKAFVQKDSGPENADGFKKDLIDAKTEKKENFFEPKKFSQNYEKTEVQTINNCMSKSIFDKLYEDVMSDQAVDTDTTDAAALGLPSVDAGEGETKEEVTLTLPHDLAVKLHELLATVIGGEETSGEETGEEAGAEGSEVATGEGADEDNEEKEEDKEEEEVAKEATELKEVPASAGQGLQKKDNKVGDVTKSLVSHGAGDGKVTDKCGNDGEKGHALVGSGVKGGASTSPKGKANVVSSKTSKVGSYLAGLK